ncbi:MAG TPA: hypothetical protein VKK81_03260, partial [Candidatus Binatia bacterium]|nr:hypothetical protein [Candidatus Binatia bacterium]
MIRPLPRDEGLLPFQLFDCALQVTLPLSLRVSHNGQCVNFPKVLRLAPPLRFRDQWNLLRSLLQLLQQTFPESTTIARPA